MRLDFCVEGVQVTGTRHPSIDSMEGQVYGGIPEDSEERSAPHLDAFARIWVSPPRPEWPCPFRR